MKKELLIINSTPILIILLVFFYNAQPVSLSASAIKETQKIVSISNGIDVPSADAGTLTLTLSMPSDKFKKDEQVILFESKLIDGLKIIYNLKNQYLEGGVPNMQSAQIALFDGQLHRIVYSYDKNRNGQVFMVDGVTIAMSQYSGKKSDLGVLTGAVIGYKESVLLEGVEAYYEEKSLIN